MAEPTTTAGGISITAVLIALLGPLAGQYTVIVMAALAGALWPLSTMELPPRSAGAKYDWFSLIAFLLPGRWSDHRKLYCFELPALVLGISTRQRVTPERILVAITKDKNA